MEYIKATEIAKDLNVSKSTIHKYIREGFLPAKLSFNSKQSHYVINSVDYQDWKSKHFAGVAKNKISKYTRRTRDLTLQRIKELKLDWLNWCATGKLNGRPISERTVEIYSYYLDLYLKKLGKYASKPIVSLVNLREVLGEIDVKSFSTKKNIYDSVMSFSKYLTKNNFIDNKLFIQELKELKPRRLFPAKRVVISEQDINRLVDFIQSNTKYHNSYDKVLSKTLITFLANTGLRASECCNLKLEDVSLINRTVYVKLGKGKKNRMVGLTDKALSVLTPYLEMRLKIQTKLENFFINRAGTAFNNQSLAKRIKRLGKQINLDISPHALRRSFVTINVNQGKPLVHLQIACGHSDITTTRNYCMTSQNEVIEAMKGW